MTSSALRPAALLLAGLLPLAAGCSVTVDKDDAGRNKDVSVKTPFASVNVKASADTPPDTGLPVHTGARAVRDDNHDNANVSVDAGFFGVKVLVARYEDEAGTQAIVDYYKKELAK